MSKKFLKTALKVTAVVAGIALAIPTGGGSLLAVGLGISATAATALTVGLSVGASLLNKPKAPKISAANETRLELSVNVRRSRVMAFGTTAFDTDLRDQEFTGANKEYLHRFVVSAAHKVQAVSEIWFDDQLAWKLSGGVQAPFAGYLTVTPVLEGGPANAINISSRMGTSRRFTGCAYVYFRFKLTGNTSKTESPFAQQVPTRVTIIGDGIRCYDPRQDGSQPGGSGAHRADDQSTWTWDDHCHNLACQTATYLLGWRIRNPQSLTWKLSVGAGTPPDRFDWPTWMDGANLCDETVTKAAGGTEPRYLGGGLVDEDDDPTTVLDGFKAAMNADIDDQDGLLRLTVFHNDLATPDADFTEADIQGDYVWLQTQSPAESFNLVRGSYIEPSTLYQATPYTEVSVDTPGGRERAHPADFGLVQSKSQAERLAKQRLQRQLYGGEFRATFLTPAWKVHKNSVVRLSFAPEGFANKLFRVVEHDGARPDGLVPMVLREEHEQIYAWDAEEGPEVELAEPTEYLPGDAPIPQFLGTIEEGATAGATIGTDVRTPVGTVALPGEVLNSGLSLTGDGIKLALRYTPDIALPPVVLSQVRAPDLGAAGQASMSQVEDALERLSAAMAQVQSMAGETRRIMRDAGISVDPANGKVHLHAFDRSEEKFSSVDLRMSAAESRIDARATTTYVDSAIALAVLDPGSVPVFTSLEARITAAELELDGMDAAVLLRATVVDVNAIGARVTTAETDIDALEGVVATKVSTTTFDALGARVTTAESTLSSIGDTASIAATVRAARMLADAADAQDASTLGALLASDRAQRNQVAAVAQARQELTAKITQDVAAEASLRTELAARVGSAEASLVTEITTRTTQVGALTSQVTTLSADLDTEEATRAAAVSTEATARADADGALATTISNVSAVAGSKNKVFAQTSAPTATGAGDLWIDTDDGNKTYRWSGSAWVVAGDTRIAGNAASITAEATARADADTALAGTISTVSAVAGSKNKVFAQTSAPTATGAGDLWIDTDDGNKTYRWSGSAWVAADDTRIATNAAAITAEATARSTADGALATTVSTLAATVGGHASSLTAFGAAIDGVEALYGVRLNVDGYVTGFVQNNNGEEGDFAIVADKFAVIDPDGGPGLFWEDGVLWNRGESISVIQGQGFGSSDDLMLWIGPNPASPAAATKASGVFWVDDQGRAFFSGATANDDYVRKGWIVYDQNGDTLTSTAVQVSGVLSVVILAGMSAVDLTTNVIGSNYGNAATVSPEVKWQSSLDKVTWSDVPGQTMSTGTIGPGSGSYTGPLATGQVSGLSPGTQIHFRVMARLTSGTWTSTIATHLFLEGNAEATAR